MEAIITAALALDLLLGDPRWLPHPVVICGHFINFGEKAIRRVTSSPRGLKVAGTLLSLGLVAGTYFFIAFILQASFRVSGYLGAGLSVLVMYQSLSVKSLAGHAREVLTALQQGNLAGAREKAGFMVARDTGNLEEGEISRAAVESVAESSVDGIVAPLFYGFIGGPPLAMAYKAVNTLDSMLGYKNDRYLHLGWAAARIDDLANYLPARVAGMIYLLLSPLTPGGWGGVSRALFRDAPRHSSPNSGIPEAAVAGALKVRLGGMNTYGGEVSFKATMGPEENTPKCRHIGMSLALMYGVTFLSLAGGIGTAQFFNL